jgi:hypothetical protein
MKARQLIANALYGPDQLKALSKAFDDAWKQVAPHASNRPEAIEAARLKLAEIVLGLAKKGNFDPQHLAFAATRLMFAGPLKPRP